VVLGGTNHHPGNKRYRKMVEDRKIDYVNCKRLDKPLVALGIIREWRGQDPPGRFLKLDEKTGLWFDVGDKKVCSASIFCKKATSCFLIRKQSFSYFILSNERQERRQVKVSGNFHLIRGLLSYSGRGYLHHLY
jgi:hypothetical protein